MVHFYKKYVCVTPSEKKTICFETHINQSNPEPWKTQENKCVSLQVLRPIR